MKHNEIMSSGKVHKSAGSKPAPKSRRDLNKETTREAILHAARGLFGRLGYAGTSLQDVVRAARVTTGAVYHHFGDKKTLFQAVAENVELEILQRVAAAAKDLPSSWERLTAGTSAMLQVSIEPDIRRIVFQDAPNVIGAATWREIELQFGYGALYRTLQELAAAGEIRTTAVNILAPMLLGALIEAANAIAVAGDPQVALADARKTVALFLESLRE
jgi:AcrR family transcriptional regulator